MAEAAQQFLAEYNDSIDPDSGYAMPTAKTRELVHEFLTPAQDEWRNCSHEFLRAIAGR